MDFSACCRSINLSALLSCVAWPDTTYPTLPQAYEAFATIVYAAMPFGFSTPLPLMKASPSCSLKSSDVSSPSQAATSSRASSSISWVIAGFAYNSFVFMTICLSVGVSVSALLPFSATHPASLTPWLTSFLYSLVPILRTVHIRRIADTVVAILSMIASVSSGTRKPPSGSERVDKLA